MQNSGKLIYVLHFRAGYEITVFGNVSLLKRRIYVANATAKDA